MRPARPERCSAEARLISSIKSELKPRLLSNRDTLARPLSITWQMPSMVTDVSATFVATTIFLNLLLLKARSCSVDESSPCNGINSTCSGSCFRASTPIVFRISPMPGMKIKMSPGNPFRRISSVTWAACSIMGSRLRYLA